VQGALSPDGRTLVWQDEFDAAEIDPSKWTYDLLPPYKYNNEPQEYTNSPENSYVENGVLKIRAISNGGKITSARMLTKNRLDVTYGFIEVRAKLPSMEGAWPAIWMLPTDWKYGGWPNSGEIDIMEHVSCQPGVVHGTVHTGAYNHMKGTQKGGGTNLGAEQVKKFHKYQVEWGPDFVKFGVDGRVYYTFYNDKAGNPATWPFDQRFHVILNIAVGGDWGGYCLDGLPQFPDDGVNNVMSVDYVRVYSFEGGGDGSGGAPQSCQQVWDVPVTDNAGTFSCGSRIEWLQSSEGGSLSETDAKQRVANEFFECLPCGASTGGCDSGSSDKTCSQVWDVLVTDAAGTFSCGSRITWLQSNEGGRLSLEDAKARVANEFCECSPCAKHGSNAPTTKAPTTKVPSKSPTKEPTTNAPSKSPTKVPTTKAPSKSPTREPTAPTPLLVGQTCQDVWEELATDAVGTFSCGSRIVWLQSNLAMEEIDAKDRVANEFPDVCGACAKKCQDVWNEPATDQAGTYTCGSRITWLQSAAGGSKSEQAAKAQVAQEFPAECGACA
jgi:beta-glucanase (GH16 family)